MRVHLTPQPIEPRWSLRAVTHDDIPAVAQLMLDAYRGTIDDEGETLADALAYVQGTFAGEQSGRMLELCSFVIEKDGKPLGAILISEWEEAPLVANVLTAPQARNQGMATVLLRQAMNALLARSYTELYLFVTEGNGPAQHVYQALGFTVIETHSREH